MLLLPGLLMMLDIPQERGMSEADIKWNTEKTCHFPLLHGLTPLSLNFMIILYALMIICEYNSWLIMLYIYTIGVLRWMSNLLINLSCNVYSSTSKWSKRKHSCHVWQVRLPWHLDGGGGQAVEFLSSATGTTFCWTRPHGTTTRIFMDSLPQFFSFQNHTDVGE